jgi:hypothetical protein
MENFTKFATTTVESVNDSVVNASVIPFPSLTPVELWIQLIFFYALIGGIISFIGNIIIAVCILKSTALRSRFFVILGFLVMVRALLSGQYFIMAVYRILRILNLTATNIKRINCYFVHFNLYSATTVEMVLLLGLVIDRALALIAYKFYRSLTLRQSIYSCLIASTVTFTLKIICSSYGMDFNEIISCVSAQSPLSNIYAYYQNIDLIIWGMILLVYFFILLYLFFAKTQIKSQHDQDQSIIIAYKRQLQVLPLLTRLVLLHCGWTLISKCMLSISGFMPSQIEFRLASYSGMVMTVDLFFNVVTLFCSNKDLKNAIFGETSTTTTVIHIGTLVPNGAVG